MHERAQLWRPCAVGKQQTYRKQKTAQHTVGVEERNASCNNISIHLQHFRILTAQHAVGVEERNASCNNISIHFQHFHIFTAQQTT